MDEAAQLKAEKQARKEAKRAKKAAAASTAVEAANDDVSTLVPTEATAPEAAADEALKAKKEKKEKKKRKREVEAAAANASTNGNEEVSVAPTIPAEEPAAVDGEKTKKKRKKNVKGAFGNAAKEAANGHAAAASTSSSANNGTATIPSISQAEIEAFQSSNALTYDPPTAPSKFAPILAFDQLPVAQGIKDGLKGFAKPTTVQSASWGVQLRTSKTARARDCVSIAATG